MAIRTRIERKASTGQIECPPLFPHSDDLMSSFGCLLWAGEQLTMAEMAERIRMEAGSLVDAAPNEADEFAFKLVEWEALAQYAEDCVVHFGALPVEFYLDYEGVEHYYGSERCLEVLGEPAVRYLMSEIQRGEEA